MALKIFWSISATSFLVSWRFDVLPLRFQRADFTPCGGEQDYKRDGNTHVRTCARGEPKTATRSKIGTSIFSQRDDFESHVHGWNLDHISFTLERKLGRDDCSRET